MVLTIVMAIYGQPKMLNRQLTEFFNYPESLRKQLRLIIVDDHGDPEVSELQAEFFGQLLRTRVFRVTDNIPWNQMGARNLGMHHATGWCVMIDPDMVFEADHLERMVLATDKIQKGRVIKYGLKHVDDDKRGINMTSPNTFLLHRDDFFACGGYDEDFAGNKGWSDVQMQEVYHQHFKIQKRPDLYALFFNNDQIADSMVVTLDRSVVTNRKIRLKKVRQQQGCGGWRPWVKKHKGPNLRFSWIQTYPT